MMHGRGFICLVIAAAVLAGATGAVISVELGHGHPGGDTDSSGLHVLEQIRSAVPLDAKGTTMRTTESMWVNGGGCPGGGFAAGWTPDDVTVVFTDASPRHEVTAQLNRVLSRLGWVSHDFGHGQPAGWERPMPQGRMALAFAFPAIGNPDSWFFDARWHPPGPEGALCP
jgi:hypothetical protein